MIGSSPENPLGTDAHLRWVGGVLQLRRAQEEGAHAVTSYDQGDRFVPTIVMHWTGGRGSTTGVKVY